MIDTIIQGDCKEILKSIESDSVDLIVTDPPYHLSNTKPIEDRIKEVVRSFNNIVFPKFNQGDIEITKYSQLVSILCNSFDLRRFKDSSIGIESWIGVPESAIDFNSDIVIRQKEIKASAESTSQRITDSELMNEFDTKESEFIGNFILDFGDSIDFPTCNSEGSHFGHLLQGFFTNYISSINFSGFPSLVSSQGEHVCGDDFMEDIRLVNNTLGQSESSTSVLTSWRAENGFMLRFDKRGASAELLIADRADQDNLLGQQIRPKLIRTFAGTGCLSTIFKAVNVSFILNIADRTYSFNFHLWIPPDYINIISQLQTTVKGFMGKEWDCMPSVDVWKECLRVLKPGAFAFIMSSPRQDVLSRMIVNLEDAGFIVGFTSIYWTYASGFPKASNISKMVDKRLGAEREVVGKVDGRSKYDNCKRVSDGINREGSTPFGNQAKLHDDTIPSTDEAKALDGSYGGFQPKPALEVVLVVMKPLAEKTYVDQALANGHGVTWLDDGRIPITDVQNESGYRPNKANHKGHGKQFGTGEPLKAKDVVHDLGFYDLQGRFPANIICSDDVLNDNSLHEGKDKFRHSGHIFNNKSKTNSYNGESKSTFGSFSRYFSLDSWWDNRIKQLPESIQKTFPFMLIPKASKSEKNKGCGGLDGKDGGHFAQDEWSRNNMGNTPDSKREKVTNHHPTVKPLKLFSYLITLGSREGDLILDPFVGSGTSCVSAKALGRHWYGIERESEYVAIAETRIAYEQRQPELELQLAGG